MSRISRTECGEWNDLWLKPAKPSWKGMLTASFLPAARLLCTKQVRMIHPSWTGWYPEVWYSLLVQHVLRSFSDFPCDYLARSTLLNAMTTELSRNSCVVHLWLRVAWPSYQPLSCGLRWNGFLMTGHLLVEKTVQQTISSFAMMERSPQTPKDYQRHTVPIIYCTENDLLLPKQWLIINSKHFIEWLKKLDLM